MRLYQQLVRFRDNIVEFEAPEGFTNLMAVLPHNEQAIRLIWYTQFSAEEWDLLERTVAEVEAETTEIFNLREKDWPSGGDG